MVLGGPPIGGSHVRGARTFGTLFINYTPTRTLALPGKKC